MLLHPMLLAAALAQAAPVDAHDPTLAKQGEFYYVVSTGRGPSPWMPLRRSKDLMTWERIGQVFNMKPAWTAADYPRTRSLWAPDLALHNGRYHLFYSVSSFGSNHSAIGRASSPTLDPASPDYGWTDHGPVIESRPGRDEWNAIDPNLVLDEQGDPWLAFGSFWGGLKLRRLNPETYLPDRQDETLYALAARPGEGAIEAPCLYRRGAYWYLFASFDHCCRGARSDYRLVVGRSDRLTGPYRDAAGVPMLEGGGTEILAGSGPERGPGHCAVLRDVDREWLAHHVYDAGDRGRPELRVRPLRWREDGWPTVGEAVGLTSK